MNKFESRHEKIIWEKYHEKTRDLPPHESLIKAVGFVDGREAALDIGAGGLRDSRYLADMGFKEVVALDSEPTVVKEALNEDNIQVIVNSFEKFDFPTGKFDLVNAQYSLPFTNPRQFNRVFSAVKNSLKKGGVFVGQLYGDRDEWSGEKEMTFLSKKEVENIISDMSEVVFSEEEKDSETVMGNKKHWHIFGLILKKE